MFSQQEEPITFMICSCCGCGKSSPVDPTVPHFKEGVDDRLGVGFWSGPRGRVNCCHVFEQDIAGQFHFPDKSPNFGEEVTRVGWSLSGSVIVSAKRWAGRSTMDEINAGREAESGKISHISKDGGVLEVSVLDSSSDDIDGILVLLHV